MLRLISLFLLAPSVGHACFCVQRPTCGDVRSQSRYFIGVPTSVNMHPAAPKGAPFASYTVRIVESLSSNVPAAGVVEIRSGTGDADCSWHFRLGTGYLIEAVGSKLDNLFTSHCNWTGEVPSRAAELRVLRDLKGHTAPPSLMASVYRSADPKKNDAEPSILSGVPVSVFLGTRTVAHATTGSNGVATFQHLAPGSYIVSAVFPQGLKLRGKQNFTRVAIPAAGLHTAPYCLVSLEGAPPGTK